MKEGGDGGFVRADQIDLKSLDEQLERHLSRALTMEKAKKKDEFGEQQSSSDVKHEWEIDASKLIIKSVIARGTFGTVHRGMYDGLDVAGKSFPMLYPLFWSCSPSVCCNVCENLLFLLPHFVSVNFILKPRWVVSFS